ncbi:MAG: hypothetical protein IT454_09865 [Planctomycetes bacterium]|nr:hypothetical protein [Planctomycetota bacterium]
MWICALLTIAAQSLELELGPVELDRFHPERATAVEARRGGSATIHVAALPPSLNTMIESSATARQILYELHESLVRREPESGEYRAVLAERFEVHDVVRLKSGDALYGDAREIPKGWSLRASGASDELLELARDDVQSVALDTVYTFHLRRDVRWHDGHVFDARDVMFSYACFRDPAVRCDRKRYLFDKLAIAEQLDAYTVRFVFAQPYFLALSTFDESFTILPAHLYDPSHAEHPARSPEASAAERARLVNEGPTNRAWVGLGPYKLVSWSGDVLEAQRFEGYFALEGCAYLERLRWRAIADNNAATNALLAGELDFLDRLSVDDYFGSRTQGASFEQRFYKGYFFTPALSVTVWNTARPSLADARVRTALGLCFDWPRFIAGFYRGLAFRVTGEQMPFLAAYDRELQALPYAPSRAAELLAECGWIDRDGDGRLDRDGAPLALTYVFPTGNEVSRTFGEAYQAELAKIGVALELAPRDSAALSELLRKREFDAAALALALPFESDPEQLWHSKWAASASANRSGLRDAEVDRMIEALQVETDAGARAALFRALQRRLYELQPVLFGVWAPRRFAMARRLRGVEILPFDPGYRARKWFAVDAPR